MKLYVEVSISTLEDDQGNITHAVGAVRDVTELIQTQKTLQKTEDNYRLLFETAPIAIMTVSSDGKILGANQHMEEITGYTLAELQTMHSNGIYADRNDYTRLQEISRKTEKSRNFETRLRRKNGSVFFARLNVDVVTLAGEKSNLIMVVDITDQKQAAEAPQENLRRLEKLVADRTKELQEAQRALIRREKLEGLGKIAEELSHELRNPIGAISNAAYYLESTMTDADEITAKQLQIISEEVCNAEKIICDLVDLGRSRSAERRKPPMSE